MVDVIFKSINSHVLCFRGGLFSGYCGPPAVEGICCVLSSPKCDKRVTDQVAYFTNKGYPRNDLEPFQCLLSIKPLEDMCWVNYLVVDTPEYPWIIPDLSQTTVGPQSDHSQTKVRLQSDHSQTTIRPMSYQSQVTVRPQSDHCHTKVRSQSDHSQTTVRPQSDHSQTTV